MQPSRKIRKKRISVFAEIRISNFLANDHVPAVSSVQLIAGAVDDAQNDACRCGVLSDRDWTIVR
jgi:hypothetical protein